MPQFINFYENVAEARLRLLNTVVTYDGHPCYVHWISEHHEDGRFRIYVEMLGTTGQYGIALDRPCDFPNRHNFHDSTYYEALDKWIERYPDQGVMRKYMSSPKFNKFRPFALGNVNYNGEVLYTERRPTRQTIQGIRQESMFSEKVSASPSVEAHSLAGKMSRAVIDIFSLELVDCIVGNYPTYEECVEHLKQPECGNSGLAFHRDFSVLRGPVRTLFLCYKTDGVGIITGDTLYLDESSLYLKEQIEELNIFSTITVAN
jgi:hypothetical protein